MEPAKETEKEFPREEGSQRTMFFCLDYSCCFQLLHLFLHLFNAYIFKSYSTTLDTKALIMNRKAKLCFHGLSTLVWRRRRKNKLSGSDLFRASKVEGTWSRKLKVRQATLHEKLKGSNGAGA